MKPIETDVKDGPPPNCCGMAVAIVKEFANFEYPVYIARDGESFDLKNDKLAIRLFKRTAAGNVSSQTRTIFLSYCPFCGAAYVGEEDEDES